MHKRALTTVGLAIAVLVAVVVPAAGAAPKTTTTTSDPAQQQRKDEINERITSLREEIAEASEEESGLLGRLDAVQDRRRELDGRVGALDKQIRKAEAEVATAQEELDKHQAEFVQAQAQLATADGVVAEARAELRKRAVSAYIGQPTAHAADLMLRARTMRDLAATVGYLEVVVSSQKTALDRFSRLRDETAELREAVAATKDQALKQRNEVLSRKAELEGARQEQDVVREEVLAQERAQAELLDEVRSRKAEFHAQIAALRAESDAVSGLLRGVQVGQAIQPSGKGVLAVPIPGARVTSVFGPRMHPIYHEMRTHDGVDFAAGTGTPIRSGADGTVVHAGPRGGYGNAVVVDHGNSLATLYAHQSAIYVSVGQRVARDQAVGAVGSTGFSTGPHLHFEVRVQGTPVDPLGYL